MQVPNNNQVRISMMMVMAIRVTNSQKKDNILKIRAMGFRLVGILVEEMTIRWLGKVSLRVSRIKWSIIKGDALRAGILKMII